MSATTLWTIAATLGFAVLLFDCFRVVRWGLREDRSHQHTRHCDTPIPVTGRVQTQTHATLNSVGAPHDHA